MPTAPKWLKIQTLDLACMLPGKVPWRHDPWRKIAKRGSGQGHV